MNLTLTKKILISFLIFFLITGFVIWRGIYTPRDSLSKREIIFDIEKGQSSKDIAFNLEKEGLIRNSFSFRIYVLINKTAARLQAGAYQLSPSMAVPQIVEKFVSGQTIKIKVSIPEGYTLKQIEEELSTEFQKKVLIQSLAGEFKNEFEFLIDVPNSETLEGFLFPDTYLFNPVTEDKEIVRIFLNNFDKKFNQELREETKKQKKTVFEIITMASLLEKEVKTKEEKELVSGILWKRIESGIPLQVDATIIYITDKKTNKVSYEETQINSFYNTYKYRGLPKGPISNPGLDSILAALYPKESDYWYYLSTPNGQTIFSHTLEEHNIAKAKYLD